MDIPYVRGRVALQAHVGVPEGTVEEEYARNGFFGRYAHLYRREAPVGWTRIEGPLKPRAYDLNRSRLPPGATCSRPASACSPTATCPATATLTEPMPYFFRNADADEVLFIHEGAGRIETDFGPLAYEPGDYLLVPRGTVYRLAPSSPTRFLTIEAFSEVRFPEKGMLGQHALFDPAVVRVPTPDEGSTGRPTPAASTSCASCAAAR
jgi:homogentisate 1,2-dioxygenase